MVPVNITGIREGEPLPFHLRNEDGQILAYRGQLAQRDVLERLVFRGRQLFIDAAEDHAGAWDDSGNDGPILRPRGQNWYDYQEEANVLLRLPDDPRFLARLTRFHDHLRDLAIANPDAALLALFYLSTIEVRFYSATHAMLVSVMCGLAARNVLNWPEAKERTLSLAALSMNVGMTELQDTLARQTTPLAPDQKPQVANHAARSMSLLHRAGVTDPDWLEAVRLHHASFSGGLGDEVPWAERMAHLIQRADSFGARRAPRATRAPLVAARAMQAIYFDDNKQIDPAGAALIKAVGIHTPGSFVQLETGEVAIVVKRGQITTTPKVLVLVNGDGIALSRFIVRDTALPGQRVARAMERSEVKVSINLERILAFA
ncbi:phosphohydrolase [Hylemonella gracilis str. Niagara R]|uniref:Phosphohydrolase n=1 Tax=Hylemonella gracilis str. Niagara R TaxID=1458275 RepID=A0A016XJL9_9BURK|nr:phosphohydrolase [Hylemonella gracilis str. Niagara R]